MKKQNKMESKRNPLNLNKKNVKVQVIGIMFNLRYRLAGS